MDVSQLRSLLRRRSDSRGASGVEYALVISLVLTGSLGSIEMMEPRIEKNYEDTATDIGQVDLDYFRVTTSAAPTSSTTTSPTTTTTSPATTTTSPATTTTSTTTAPTTTAAPAPTTTIDPASESLVATAANATASGNFESDGTGFGVPNSGNTNNWGGAGDTSDTITFSFTVVEAGTYNITSSVKAPSGSDNSFYVTVNGAPSNGWLWDTRQSNSYQNDWINDRNGGDPQGVYLEPGDHEVTLHKREDGTYVQSLELVLQD